MTSGVKTIIYPVKDVTQAKALFGKLLGAEPIVDQPYYVGYVELPGELIVETKFVGFDERPPSIGDEVEFVLVPFRSEGDDVAVTSYAFRPIAGGTDR